MSFPLSHCGLLSVLIALVLSPFASVAQPVELKLTADDGMSADGFGRAVAVAGGVALVGATHDDDGGTDTGSVYVFRRVGGAWVEKQKLAASDGSGGDRFGFSVAVAGDIAIVGAFRDDDQGPNSGSAYVFRRVGGRWVEEQKLTASDGNANALFGRAVSLSGDVAVIGAREHDDRGAAYVFRRVGEAWVEEQKLTAADGSGGDRFGRAVSVSGDVAVVGADRDDDQGQNSGSAYVFRRVGGMWVEEQKLVASDGSDDDHFGARVSLSGDVAVIGALEDDDHGVNSGAVYVFRRVGGAWVEEQKLSATDGQRYDRFGYAVSISGGVVVVGSYADDDNGQNSGSAYVYSLTAEPISIAPVTPPVVLPPAGGAFDYAAFVPNNGPTPITFDAWITVTLPDGSHHGPIAGPVAVTLAAHSAVMRVPRLRVPGPAPPGTYTLTLNVGDYPSNVVSSDGFTFVKQAGGPPPPAGPITLSPDGGRLGDGAPEAPMATALFHPNPARGRAVLRYTLAAPGPVRFVVYDALGREVACLVDAVQGAGPHEAALDGRPLPAGVYVWRLEHRGQVATGRFTLMK